MIVTCNLISIFHTFTYGAGSGRANAQPAATLSAAQQPHIAALMQVRVLLVLPYVCCLFHCLG